MSLPLDRLSPAERRVYDLALDGRSTHAVAEELVLSEATVRSHLTRIYAKLDVRGRMDLLGRLAGAEGSGIAPFDLSAPATASPYGPAPWTATIVALVGLVAGFVVPASALVSGPILLILGFVVGRRLPEDHRWAWIVLMGAGAILLAEALMIVLLVAPG